MAGLTEDIPVPPTAGVSLKNRVFLIRHGLAESNVQGILVSDPKDGVPSFGLVDEGKKQAKEASLKLESLLSNPESVTDLSEKMIVVSSDFKRTMETAQIIHDHFKVTTPICAESALRERWFGEFHLTPVSNSHMLMEKDKLDPTHKTGGCESMTEMVLRVSRLLGSLDKDFSNKIIILVSHGDPLSTLWSICKGVPPNENRLPRFKNCDLREFC